MNVHSFLKKKVPLGPIPKILYGSLNATAHILILLGIALPISILVGWYFYFDFDIRRDGDPVGYDATYINPGFERFSHGTYSNDSKEYSFTYSTVGEMVTKESARWAFNDYHLGLYDEWVYMEQKKAI